MSLDSKWTQPVFPCARLIPAASKRKASEDASSSRSKKARTESPFQNGMNGYEYVSFMYALRMA